MTTDSESTIITEEASKRVCAHMNADHPVCVYGMANELLHLPRNWKITQSTLTKITENACDVRAVTCCGDSCTMHKLQYPFGTPVKTSADLRQRMIAIHQYVCAAKMRWLISPIPVIILVTCFLLTYGTFVMGEEELTKIVEGSPVHEMVSLVFGSASYFSKVVKWSCWFAWTLHFAEAVYVAREARKLKLKFLSVLKWMVLCTLTGYPITKEFFDLLRVHNELQTNQKVKEP
jgi:hypothetical protein